MSRYNVTFDSDPELKYFMTGVLVKREGCAFEIATAERYRRGGGMKIKKCVPLPFSGTDIIMMTDCEDIYLIALSKVDEQKSLLVVSGAEGSIVDMYIKDFVNGFVSEVDGDMPERFREYISDLKTAYDFGVAYHRGDLQRGAI